MLKMKKYIGIAVVAMALCSCDSHTYEEIGDHTVIEGDVTYNANVKAIIDANCISCHSDGGVTAYRPLTTYAEVKDAIENTNLLERIQRMDGEEGIMPQTGRMPQDKINIILEWNMDGLLEN
jgi:mono/diheme cytochrome c family protein